MSADSTRRERLIDRWFPCTAVDNAVGSPAGSGRSEKAVFTWFASRPVAQARAAVLCTLLPDAPENRKLVEKAVLTGNPVAIAKLGRLIDQEYPEGRPVVMDIFSGRGMIPLEAARLGTRAVGLDLSPVATLAGRLLADYPLRDWSAEPPLPFQHEDEERLPLDDQPRLVSDIRRVLDEVGRRMTAAVEPYYPRNPDGAFPWGYLWAITVPCDGCRRRFPLVGSLTLRHPYRRTKDQGQAFRIVTESDHWAIQVIDGVPDQQPTFASAAGKKGKSARCPFCRHVHSLDAVKAMGFAGEYRDAVLLAADLVGTTKVFRTLRRDERLAVEQVDLRILPPLGRLSAVPDEIIPSGNEDTVRASGYGFSSYGQLMCDRQTLQFVAIARAIRDCHRDLLSSGVSPDYARALSEYAAANLVRAIKHSTRGATLRGHGNQNGTAQNRNQIDHIYSGESKVAFSFDYFEAAPGPGPGSWASMAETATQVLMKHVPTVGGRPAKFRRGSAMSLPVRDGTVDAVVTDPPYYNMIDYSDASDLLFVWLKRALSEITTDLFDEDGLQDKTDEIIVKRGHAEGEHRTKKFYESSLSRAFAEARRVLRPDGHLVVVFGHSDPDAWRRLLAALHEAGLVVTSSWPSRTESANTGVASIKVTVTIGCRVAADGRPAQTAVHVDREVSETVRARVKDWERDGLALTDQLMAANGPAMEVFGRYSEVLLPTGPAPLDRYLTLARRAVLDAMAMKVDQIPLETFDAVTRFAVYWLRFYGRTKVPKGEARFHAQAVELRIEDVRDSLLSESSAGYSLVLGPPKSVTPTSPVIDVVRMMSAEWQSGGTDAVAMVLAQAGRAADDQHLWAVTGDLLTQLPSSDPIARSLTAIQRNAQAIQSITRGLEIRRTAEEAPQLDLIYPDQLTR